MAANCALLSAFAAGFVVAALVLPGSQSLRWANALTSSLRAAAHADGAASSGACPARPGGLGFACARKSIVR